MSKTKLSPDTLKAQQIREGVAPEDTVDSFSPVPEDAQTAQAMAVPETTEFPYGKLPWVEPEAPVDAPEEEAADAETYPSGEGEELEAEASEVDEPETQEDADSEEE